MAQANRVNRRGGGARIAVAAAATSTSAAHSSRETSCMSLLEAVQLCHNILRLHPLHERRTGLLLRQPLCLHLRRRHHARCGHLCSGTAQQQRCAAGGAK